MANNNQQNTPFSYAIQLGHFGQYNSKTRYQTAPVPPNITPKDELAIINAFKQLHNALETNYLWQIKVKTYEDTLQAIPQDIADKLVNAATSLNTAYDEWETLISAIPESYKDFCAAIENQQAFNFATDHRTVLLREINSNIELVTELLTPSENSSIIHQFREKWIGERDKMNSNNVSAVNNTYDQLLTALAIATNEQNSKTKRAQGISGLQRYIQQATVTLLNQLAEVDSKLGVKSHKEFLDSTSFSYLTIDPNRYSRFIDKLKSFQKTDNGTKNILKEMMEEFTLKRNQARKNGDEQTTQDYVTLRVAVQNLLNQCDPAYRGGNPQDQADDINVLIQYVETCLTNLSTTKEQYLAARNLQSENTILLEQRSKDVQSKIDRLYIQVLTETIDAARAQPQPRQHYSTMRN
jgi:hypothetical protein